MVGKEDETWQAIVDNYGDRVDLGPEEGPALEPVEPGIDHRRGQEAEPADVEYDEPTPPEDPDDAFVPPPLPPVPRPSNDRLAAYLGVFGAPVLMVLLVALQVTIPGWAALLLAGAFVGGFLYLVMRSPRSPRDPWDDGARV